MRDWQTVTLDELGDVARGRSRHRPRNDPALFGGDYPFFQTGDVKAADLWLTRCEQTYNRTGLAQSKLWPRGTLCITIAANIAESSLLGVPGCFPDSVVAFTPHPGVSDVFFAKYLLDHVKLRMQSISQGTTQDNLSLDKLLSVPLKVPDFETQRKIASVLLTYSELIETNARRIEVLEEMAQTIYRQWFVEYRYPGHEDVPLVGSDLGPIPEGWTVEPLGNVAGVNKRSLKPNADVGEIRYLDISSVETGRIGVPTRVQFDAAPCPWP